MSGKFIVIEGLDGSGKTTHSALLGTALTERGFDVWHTAEPTGGTFGRLCRQALSGKIDCSKTLLASLFVADRIEHNIELKEKLEQGKTVICDRYYYSNMAYQGIDTSLEWLRDMNKGCPDIRRPDLCVFLDLEPKKSMERILSARDESEIEIYETEEKLAGIRQRFFDAFDALTDENIAIVSSDGTIEQVSERILNAVLGLQ